MIVPTSNWLHIVGIAVVILNGIAITMAAKPGDYGITWPYAGAYLALVGWAIGVVLKEMPSLTQQSQITSLKAQVEGLGGKPRDGDAPS